MRSIASQRCRKSSGAGGSHGMRRIVMTSSAGTPNYAGHQIPNTAIFLKLANIESDSELHLDGYHQPDIRQTIPAIHIARRSRGGDYDLVIVEDLAEYPGKPRPYLVAIHALVRNTAISSEENIASMTSSHQVSNRILHQYSVVGPADYLTCTNRGGLASASNTHTPRPG